MPVQPVDATARAELVAAKVSDLPTLPQVVTTVFGSLD